MSGRIANRVLALALCLALLGAEARAGDPREGDSSLERWGAAAKSYPDDPDVAWAYALALADAGRDAEALARLREIAVRWPERTADAAFKAGSIHWANAHYKAALRSFEDAIAEDPLRGDARLYRALALQALGRDDDAQRELQVLARVAPELAPDALLLQGLERVRKGDRAGSVELLSQVISLDPSGQPASEARAALALLDSAGSNRVIAWGTVGGESDSNVTLDNGAAPASDRADLGLVFGAGLAGSLYRTERLDLSLGYAYNGSLYHDLKSYDLQAHSLIGSAAWLAPGLGAIRLDGSLLDAWLGGAPYLESALVRPNLVIPFGESSATLRLYGEIERRNYQRNPSISSLDRDGSTYRLGFEQTLPLPFWPGAFGSLQGRIGRTNTLAHPDLLGFEGDFDSRRAEIATELHLPVSASCDARLASAWIRDRYVNPSLIAALSDGGLGEARRRHDVTVNGVAAFGCEPLPGWRVETRWFGTRARSNVDVYDYRRSVIGLYLTREYGWP